MRDGLERVEVFDDLAGECHASTVRLQRLLCKEFFAYSRDIRPATLVDPGMLSLPRLASRRCLLDRAGARIRTGPGSVARARDLPTTSHAIWRTSRTRSAATGRGQLSNPAYLPALIKESRCRQRRAAARAGSRHPTRPVAHRPRMTRAGVERRQPTSCQLERHPRRHHARHVHQPLRRAAPRRGCSAPSPAPRTHTPARS